MQLLNKRRRCYGVWNPQYIPFEDQEALRVCCLKWGDYNKIEVTDNGDNTVNITTTFESRLNTKLKKNKLVNVLTNVDNSDNNYIVGITAQPVGITMRQCKAVTNMNSAFNGNTIILKFNELLYFRNATFRECFSGATNLTEVVLPDNLTTVYYRMFRSSGIQSIIIPNTVTQLGAACFSQCYNLTSMLLSNRLVRVEGYAFQDVPLGGKLVMPQTFTTGDSRWIWAAKINTLEIPGYLQSADITFRPSSNADNPPVTVVLRYAEDVNNLGFGYTGGTGNIYVPDSLVSDYKLRYSAVESKIKPLSEYIE